MAQAKIKRKKRKGEMAMNRVQANERIGREKKRKMRKCEPKKLEKNGPTDEDKKEETKIRNSKETGKSSEFAQKLNRKRNNKRYGIKSHRKEKTRISGTD